MIFIKICLFFLFTFLPVMWGKDSIQKDSNNLKAFLNNQFGEVEASSCKKNKAVNEFKCKWENYEYIERLRIKTFDYKIREEKNKLIQSAIISIDDSNVIYEGYNLYNIFPNLFDYIEVMTFDSNKNALNTNVVYNLYSASYNLNIELNFSVKSSIFQNATNPLQATLIDYEFKNNINDNAMINDYRIIINEINLNLNSISLNNVLFDLYKREQRIASDENSQNDKDYLARNDDILFDDYKNFIISIFESINVDNEKLSDIDSKKLQDIKNTFMQVATKSNINVKLKLLNKDFSMSLQDLENLINIDSNFNQLIMQILKNSTLVIETTNI